MYGLGLIETPVGFKFIGEKLRGGDVLLGGEESGGFTFNGHIPEKDGIMANLLVVEMLAYEKKPLSQIWQELQKEAGLYLTYLRADLKLTLRTQKALMERLSANPMTTLAGEKVVKVGRSDGLKLYLDHNNWMLIRPSGTEPLIRLYFECTSPEKAEKIKADFNKQVDKILADLDAKPIAEAIARH